MAVPIPRCTPAAATTNASHRTSSLTVSTSPPRCPGGRPYATGPHAADRPAGRDMRLTVSGSNKYHPNLSLEIGTHIQGFPRCLEDRSMKTKLAGSVAMLAAACSSIVAPAPAVASGGPSTAASGCWAGYTCVYEHAYFGGVVGRYPTNDTAKYRCNSLGSLSDRVSSASSKAQHYLTHVLLYERADCTGRYTILEPGQEIGRVFPNDFYSGLMVIGYKPVPWTP
jgi:hypothetical protein